MFQLKAAVAAEIEIKKSRFLGQLYPIYSRQEAQRLLTQIRGQHPNAVHVCWVLLCEGDSGLDDDGEPSGTAAKPIYNVLVHKELFNVLAVVVRYWGGTKLGAGGLTRAYGQAISDAFKEAELVAIEVLSELKLALNFSDESLIRRLCDQYGATVLQVDYAEQAHLTIKLKANQTEQFFQEACNVLRGNLRRISSEESEERSE
ncbi:IMPACT family protein [Undibacterium fentianense]|uniref:YigZ family protein n=1 Tax=Undibacterium fentianense TaxID=2828728 RepID=A0A941E871_9BURK|nr:YigZ family protein [Undibacterium fentianense]MBR7801523.1 YigZ family protein [Undibacterium fentianense]